MGCFEARATRVGVVDPGGVIGRAEVLPLHLMLDLPLKWALASLSMTKPSFWRVEGAEMVRARQCDPQAVLFYFYFWLGLDFPHVLTYFSQPHAAPHTTRAMLFFAPMSISC